MGDTTCSLKTCSEPTKRMGLCYGHYMKQWRYGTPTPDFPPRYTDLTGRRFGNLTVIERVGSTWACRCDCGAETNVRAGDLNRGTVESCGDRSTHRRIESPGYGAVHDRLRVDRGNARDFRCVDCDQPAFHWSYDHCDPNELHTPEGYAYSVDPDHYLPRCVPCHKRFDLDRIDSALASVRSA